MYSVSDKEKSYSKLPTVGTPSVRKRMTVSQPLPAVGSACVASSISNAAPKAAS